MTAVNPGPRPTIHEWKRAHGLAKAVLMRATAQPIPLSQEETELLARCVLTLSNESVTPPVGNDDPIDGPHPEARSLRVGSLRVEAEPLGGYGGGVRLKVTDEQPEGDALVGAMTREEEAREFADHHGLPYLARVDSVAGMDVFNILTTDPIYGGSWQRRGGVGAFMMLARKWDRLEERVRQLGWDVFKAIKEDTRREGVIDDVRDLRRYLMLVEAKALTDGIVQTQTVSKDSVR